MTGWLLDTNVISELRRPRPSARVRRLVAAQRLDDLYISTVILAELRFGIESVADPVRRAELHGWLALSVRPMFEQRVLGVTEEVMLRWRLLVEEGRKTDHTYSQPDLLIAAIALEHGLTVVTRDVADFARAGATVQPLGVMAPAGSEALIKTQGRCTEAAATRGSSVTTGMHPACAAATPAPRQA